jgi:NADH-quinone oxidoreductase subunit F
MRSLALADGPELVQRALASGLRGRGGGWFLAGRKWQAVRAEGGDPLVIGNGAEGEPGSIKDRYVMTSRPRDVLEGLVWAARAVGAKEAMIYLKGSFSAPAAALELSLHGFDSGEVRITVHRGEEGYIAGEETAVLEALEGRRPWPRPKPPLPSAVGFRGRPTLVQNVETLARVPSALRDPAAFPSRESTLVSLWGHVRRPGVYDIPLGTPISRLIEETGGGVPGGALMVFPAGPSGAPLPTSAFETPLDPDRLRAAGSALGTASVLVISQTACAVSVAVSLASFFERESCGQCPPCTVGTMSLARILRRVDSGSARPSDLQALAETAGFMSGHGYCAHGRSAASSLTGFVSGFWDEVKAHIEGKPCPHGGASADPFGDSSPERLLIEGIASRGQPA